MNNGDDCVVFMERKDLGRYVLGLEEWFLELGFRMVAEPPAYELPKIEFCQMRCIRTADGPRMVRNLEVAIAKDAMCTLNLGNEKAMRKWLHAVGDCGLALCSGIPILQSFYSMYKRAGLASNISKSNAFISGMTHLRGDLESKCSAVSDEARLDTYIAWGITPDEQVEREKLYAKMTIEYSDSTASDHVEINHMEF